LNTPPKPSYQSYPPILARASLSFIQEHAANSWPSVGYMNRRESA